MGREQHRLLARFENVVTSKLSVCLISQLILLFTYFLITQTTQRSNSTNGSVKVSPFLTYHNLRIWIYDLRTSNCKAIDDLKVTLLTKRIKPTCAKSLLKTNNTTGSDQTNKKDLQEPGVWCLSLSFGVGLEMALFS